MISGIFKIINILLTAAFILLIASCPNDQMRDLVELKVSDPVADSFIINSGGDTSSLTVILNSDVSKEEDSLEMRFKNSGYDWSDWESYSNTKTWTLPIGDGIKTVYAEYRDEGHHVVSKVNNINLDTGAPAGAGFYVWGTGTETGQIHDYVNDRNCTLFVNVAGADRMRFSNSPVGNTIAEWDAATPAVGYANSYSWTLSAGDGTKTVYSQFLDAADNFPDPPYTYSLTLDETAPVVDTFQINSNDATANSIGSTLTYNFTEANQVWAEYRNDGGSWSARDSITGGSETTDWVLRSETGTRTVYVRLTDIAGNVSSVYSDSIYLSTAAPSYPVPTTATPTNDTTPTWTWSAVAGAVNYRYYFPDFPPVELGNVTSFTPPSPLDPNTEYTFYLQAADIAGNWSEPGSHTVTIDTDPPEAPTGLDLASSDDTGSSSTDNITNVNSGLTISGTAEANSTVSIYDNTTLLQTTEADGSGNFSRDITLTEGLKSIRARATDEAGNVSAYSSILTITVDTTEPSAPSLPDLANTDDFGISQTDNITNITNNLSFSGTAETGTVLTLYDNTTVKGSMTVSSGNYSFDISLAEGPRTIRARTVDTAGNVSPYSASLAVTIDTTPPSYTNITVDPHTTSNQPEFTWVGASGAVRYRYSWNNSAPWTIITSPSVTPLLPSNGTYTLYVQHGDAAGNWSSGSGTGTTTYYYNSLSFSTGTASKWFGGDSTVSPGRNVGAGQKITFTDTSTLKTFAFYISGINSGSTIKLSVRNSSTGAIISSYTTTYSGTGWVYWTGLNNNFGPGTTYIFTAYLVDGGVNQDSGGINGDGGTGGNGYTCDSSSGTNASMETWSNWSTHPWNFWYKVFWN